MNLNNLRKDEINDKLTLYQIKDGLLFGTDALMLADFVCAESMGAYKTGVEFGAGSGVISLLLAAREKIRLIYAVEIQEIYAELAEYNASVNKLENIIKIICADLKDCDNLYYKNTRILPHAADMIFTNPPYIKYAPAGTRNGAPRASRPTSCQLPQNEGGCTGGFSGNGKLSAFAPPVNFVDTPLKEGGITGNGKLSARDYKNIARREIACDIFDILKSAARLIKNGGDFYIVYRPDRLQSLFAAMQAHNITPKKIKFIFAGQNKPASLVLLKGKQGAGEGLVAEHIFI